MREFHILAVVLVVLLVPACAAASAGDGDAPVPHAGWRVGTAEHVALWFHSLARTGAWDDGPAGAAPGAGHVSPAEEARRSLGLPPTPLGESAAEFRRRFEADPAFLALDGVPLHFRDTRAITTGIRYWADVDGDSRRVRDREAREMVTLLSTWFPRASQRRVLAEWIDAVEQEHRLYFAEHWPSEQRNLSVLADDVQGLWRDLEPAVQPFLRYVGAGHGELIVVRGQRAASSAMVGARGSMRVAVVLPRGADAATAVWLLVRELIGPVADDAVRDYVAPARIRELGRERLADRAAIRAAALLLDRAAPRLAANYRSFFLVAAGGPELAGAVEDLDSAFAAAFPLPVDLETGLERHVAAAMAGI